ncbi:hypothetical protein VKT23_001142 [Stygiomarasmius scandens]|uniref:Uncharacterized protein n=1 Tax=Marasmiellus scandens TaxID=2682957 RepID=A0ABR1K665_9AGAR
MPSESLTELQKLLSNVHFKAFAKELEDTKPQSIQGKKKVFMDRLKEVYTFVEGNILPTRELKTVVPPLQMITYETRKIIYPDLLYNHIPTLLELLYNVELYRLYTVRKAEEAISFDNYYKLEQYDGPGLTKEEIETLEDFQAHGEAARELYIDILKRFCTLDIYHLWTTTGKSIEVLTRLNQHFPMLSADQTERFKQPTPEFLLDLSEKEQEIFRDTGEDCSTFLIESTELAGKRRDKSQTLLQFFQSPEFISKHPPIDLGGITYLTEYYLACVEGQASELERIFPSTFQDLETA